MVGAKKVLGILALIGLIAYILAISFFEPAISAMAQSSNNPLIMLGLYYAGNPPFIILVIAFALLGYYQKKSLFRWITAGFVISTAMDISSLPHCVSSAGLNALPASNFACSDTAIILGLTQIGIPFDFSFAFYYFVLPILLVFIAFEIVGATNFLKLTLVQSNGT